MHHMQYAEEKNMHKALKKSEKQCNKKVHTKNKIKTLLHFALFSNFSQYCLLFFALYNLLKLFFDMLIENNTNAHNDLVPLV